MKKISKEDLKGKIIKLNQAYNNSLENLIAKIKAVTDLDDVVDFTVVFDEKNGGERLKIYYRSEHYISKKGFECETFSVAEFKIPLFSPSLDISKKIRDRYDLEKRLKEKERKMLYDLEITCGGIYSNKLIFIIPNYRKQKCCIPLVSIDPKILIKLKEKTQDLKEFVQENKDCSALRNELQLLYRQIFKEYRRVYLF